MSAELPAGAQHTALRVVGLTALTMIAFAGNSLFCRLAFQSGRIDAASFTAIRLASGALVLWLLARRLSPDGTQAATPAGQTHGSWGSALALFAYAILFSYAYLSLSAATGALLLFAAVQTTMIGYGLWSGERLSLPQLAGLVLALGGLVGLLLPGASAPAPLGALCMLGAGIAWGVYSLRGKGARSPTAVTAGNFRRAVPMAAALSLATLAQARVDATGLIYALASGALASGLGYALWYAVLPRLQATHAATVQLSVPVLAAVGGILFLGEAPGLRLLFAALAVLGGIALVIAGRTAAR